MRTCLTTPTPGGAREPAREPRARHVEHDAIGILEDEHAVLGAAGKIQHHSRALGTRPQAHGAHLHRSRRHDQGDRDEKCHESGAQRSHGLIS